VSGAETLLPPPVWLLALEGRAWFELAAFVPGLPLLAGAPHGDGHPVLVLPGWLASDTSTRPLRTFLRGPGLPRARLAPRAKRRRDAGRDGGARGALARGARAPRALGEPGGVESRRHLRPRELARRFPDEVRQVITLATRFRDSSATAVARFVGRRRRAARHVLATNLGEPLSVPTTSILSRSDGIVAGWGITWPRSR
jgi:hypothetical protein